MGYGHTVDRRRVMRAVVHPVSAGPDTRIARLIKLLVERQRLASLDQLRERLPLTDPDRHDLDVDADHRFAAMAIAHPETCTPREDDRP
jgi:hypothetical protein